MHVFTNVFFTWGVDAVYVRGDLYAGKYKPDEEAYKRSVPFTRTFIPTQFFFISITPLSTTKIFIKRERKKLQYSTLYSMCANTELLYDY